MLAVPEAPTNLTATPVSSSQIELTWQDNSDDETGFRLEYRKWLGTWTLLDEVAQDTESYSHEGLDPATRYEYRVQACGGDWAFQEHRAFAVGDAPISVAIGDLNGDGTPDLAVANIGSRSVSVLLGNGDAKFQAQRTFAVGDSPHSVTIGDLNGDGAPDLAVANWYSDSVSVLLGNGDGMFQAQRTFAVGDAPISVAIGDLDGDGAPDLAVANGSSDNISVLLGNGDGTFRAQRTFAAGDYPESVAIGDFDGDGAPDLAVANNHSDNVSVLLGNGNVAFQAQMTFAAGDGPSSVAIGDLDGDETPDLALANGYSDNISVLLSNGDGTFESQRIFAAGDNPRSVAIGDLDGDGTPDLVVANIGSRSVSVLLGDGNGTFQSQMTFAAGDGPESVAIGDFDGNGALDLGVANIHSDNVSVLLGNGNGTFQAQMTFAAGDDPYSIVIGDFDGDGAPDIAVANASSDNVSVLLGNANGMFQARMTFAAGDVPISVAVGDFDGDGAPDLAVANRHSDNVSVLLGNGNGTFQAQMTFAAGDDPYSIVIEDFDGDGAPDIAAANGISDNVSVLLGNGNGTFQAQRIFAAGNYPNSVATGDFNADGKTDLAVANQRNLPSAGVSVLLGNGNGTFQTQKTFAAGYVPHSVATGDFNGDGIADLAVANGDSDSVSVLLGNGDGTFQSQKTFAARDYPMSAATGDFNGDGETDLAVANGWSDNLSVLLGNGDGTFQAQKIFTAGAYPSSIATGDFNGDGEIDLAVANYNSDSVSVLIGARGGSSAWAGTVEAYTFAEGVIVRQPPLGATAFDGTGADVRLVTDGGVEEGSFGVWAAMGDGSWLEVGFSPTKLGGTLWQLDIDLDSSGLFAATRIMVAAKGDFTISGTPQILHDSIAELEGFETIAPQVLEGLEDFVSAAYTDYRSVPVLYAWDWETGRFIEGKDAHDNQWPIPLNESSLERLKALFPVGRRNIIVTHGWNDGIEIGGHDLAEYEYATVFANNYMLRNPGDKGRVNLLAIDWSGRRSDGSYRLGSDPNDTDDLGALARIGAEAAEEDARASARNGIIIGGLVGNLLSSAGLNPGSTMLLGHSNGAGFMAALATAVHDSGVGNIQELVTLDAPFLTASAWEVCLAARHVDRLVNVFGELPDFRAELESRFDVFDGLDVGEFLRGLLDRSGFGAPMPDTGNLVNIQLDPDYTRTLLGDLADVGSLHNWIPLRYAASVDPLSHGDDLWAFPGSAFATNGNVTFTNFYSREGSAGGMVCVDLDKDAFTVECDEWLENTFEDTFPGVMSVWDGLVDRLGEIVRGVSVLLVLPAPLGSTLGLINLLFDAQSPATATLDIDIPEGASLLTFDLTVLDPGNDDVLQIAIGDQLVGEVRLSAVLATGGRRVQLPIDGLGGTGEPLVFHMPSEETSSAEFLVSNVEFKLQDAWKRAFPGAIPSASAGGSGLLTVTTLNGSGRAVAFSELPGGGWEVVDLQTVTGSPAASGHVESWTDPNDGLTYAAATSSRGLVLFRRAADGTWSYRNLNEEIAGIGMLVGDVTVFTSTTKLVHIAGLDAAGDMILFQQTGGSNANGYAWTAVNLGETLRDQGQQMPAFSGPIISYVTTWNGLNIAGLDSAGNIQAVWSGNGGLGWNASNLSNITGAPPMASGLTAYLTDWGGINIIGLGADGSVMGTWWVPSFKGNWRVDDLTAIINGPKLSGDSVASFVAPWGALNIAGMNTNGELVAYWWTPGTNRWQVANMSNQIPGDAFPVGPVRGVTRSGPARIDILSPDADGNLLRYWWRQGDPWQVQDISASV